MTDFNFLENYPGPIGRHLNFLTRFTLTRDESKRGGESIHHPGHDAPYRGLKTQNTMRRRKRSTIERAIAGVTEHLDRHPNDAVSALRLRNLQAL